jgi:DNA-binding response OmpR family regulator
MGDAPRILVADDDAWILRMVTTVLEKRGYAVTVACDGEEALEKASQCHPDLIVTDVMMPRMDGWALVKALRARAEFAFVPVIFLTALGSDDDRIRGFRLGADDYLSKPFRFEELDLRVTNTLRRRQLIEQAARERINPPPPLDPNRPRRDSGPHTGLTGRLQEVGLPSLLTLLEMERKTGVLVLTGDGEVGRVFVRDGRIVAAAIDGRGEPNNAECIYHLLAWRSGKFSFKSVEVDLEDSVGQATMHLLMEGARRLDEAAR